MSSLTYQIIVQQFTQITFKFLVRQKKITQQPQIKFSVALISLNQHLKNPRVLFRKQVDFLGYIVSEKGVCVQEGKIQAVKEWPLPHTITELQQFLGVCNYYRHYIWQYATVAAPLTDILWQKGTFTLGIEQERAFQKLKDALTQAPVFTIFDPALSRRVLDDTSSISSGAISEQLVNGYWHPVEYFSK